MRRDDEPVAPGIGTTRLCPGAASAHVWLGSDPRTSSRPAATCAASTGRTHGCTQPGTVIARISLAKQGPSTHVSWLGVGKEHGVAEPTTFALLGPAGRVPSRRNRPGNYEAFCEEVDKMVDRLPGHTSEQIERRLFSSRKRLEGEWRHYLRRAWKEQESLGTYSRERMHARYPKIPLEEF